MEVGKHEERMIGVHETLVEIIRGKLDEEDVDVRWAELAARLLKANNVSAADIEDKLGLKVDESTGKRPLPFPTTPESHAG